MDVFTACRSKLPQFHGFKIFGTAVFLILIRRRLVHSLLLLVGLAVLSQLVIAQVDIRVANPSTLLDAEQVDYVASIEDCGSLASIKAGSGSDLTVYGSDAITFDPANPQHCLLSFSLTGSGSLNPTVAVVAPDASEEIFNTSKKVFDGGLQI